MSSLSYCKRSLLKKYIDNNIRMNKLNKLVGYIKEYVQYKQKTIAEREHSCVGFFFTSYIRICTIIKNFVLHGHQQICVEPSRPKHKSCNWQRYIKENVLSVKCVEE